MNADRRPTLGDFFAIRKERGEAGLPTMSVTLNSGLVVRGDLDRRTETNLAPEQHLRVRPGDIAYNMMRMWQGAFGLAQADGMVSPAYVVLRPKKGIDGRFAYHWFKMSRMTHYFWAYSHGLTGDRLRLYFDDFSQIPAELPSLHEQQHIANILDTWDRAIEETRKIVAAKRCRYRALVLRLSKDFHMERTEFGRIVHLVSDRTQPSRSMTSVESVELENIESNTGRITGSQVVDTPTSLRNRFRKGDVLFGKLRPYLRKFAKPTQDGLCSTEIWVLRANQTKCIPLLLFFLVQTPEFQAAAEAQSGSRMPRADWDYVSSRPVPLPSGRAVQQHIAERLELAFREADLAANYIDGLLAQKLALTQNLLMGEWRTSKFEKRVSVNQ